MGLFSLSRFERQIDMEIWCYKPQRDITTYELALVVKHIGGIWGGLIHVPADKNEAPNWNLIKRHFVREAA